MLRFILNNFKISAGLNVKLVICIPYYCTWHCYHAFLWSGGTPVLKNEH